MISNIAVAEQTDNLLCQDTGIPIYNVLIGRGVEVDAHDGIASRRRSAAAASARRASIRCAPRSCIR